MGLYPLQNTKLTAKICQVYAKILKDCIEKGKDPRGISSA